MAFSRNQFFFRIRYTGSQYKKIKMYKKIKIISFPETAKNPPAGVCFPMTLREQ